jgi:hypothetical protein
MGILATIGAFLQLVLLIFQKWAERDAAKKAKQEAVIKEVQNAIDKRDPSLLNLALTRRMR